MNDIISSRSVALSLMDIKPLTTSKISMWSLSNKYDYPPMLRFKFKNISTGDLFYDKIKHVVQGFCGKLEWTIINNKKYPNCILLPKMFEKYMLDGNISFKEDTLGTILGTNKYHDVVDWAILDAPHLAKYIKKNSININD